MQEHVHKQLYLVVINKRGEKLETSTKQCDSKIKLNTMHTYRKMPRFLSNPIAFALPASFTWALPLTQVREG